MVLMLAGCFRDASDDQREPTAANIDVTARPPDTTPTPITPTVATLTPRPSLSPTSTFPVGGPPVSSDDDEDAEETDIEVTPTSTGVPTRVVPSFTPRSSTFGDPGITPTEAPQDDEFEATPTAFVAENVDECIYVVQGGDTLFSIATQYDLLPEDFVAVNPALAANPNALSIGQELQIPNCESAFEEVEEAPEAEEAAEESDEEAEPVEEAAPPEGTITHTVQNGENLFRIAIQYDTTIDAIVAANAELINENTPIYPGQVLIIPVEP
jgi:LysM repeat protein